MRPVIPNAGPRITGDAAALEHHHRGRLRAAAVHAQQVYPGPLGELVSRELRFCADFGYGLATDGLASRLAGEVLARPAAG